MVACSKRPNRREKFTPRRRKTFIHNACIEEEPTLRTINLNDEGEVWVVLTREERGTINVIQQRDPKQEPKVTFRKTAENLGMPEYYLRALSSMDLPRYSNEIPQSSINQALKKGLLNSTS
jgi:hypothetical protein